MSDDESGGFFDGHGLQSMGILNALRTGDPRIDMAIALMFPFVIQQAFEWFRILKEWITKDWKMAKVYDERTIVHTATKDRYGSSYRGDQDTQNTILLKAIQLYLHSEIKLELPQAEVDLTSTEDKNSNVGRTNYYYYDSDDDDADNDRTIVGALSKYKVIQTPPPGRWFDLGIHGGEAKVLSDPDPDPVHIQDETNDNASRSCACNVWLRIERDEEARENGASKEVTCCFRFQADHGKAIDAFIDKAYQWYMGELRKMEDHARYLYELKAEEISFSRKNDDEDGRTGRTYTRYRLSDEKTFESLFFAQKSGLLKILDHFMQRSGKYAIKGYPHKLGLLLTGPPGTGKTSLIKALAHYTGRSIINVPLTRVTTNSELMAIFNDAKKYVDGESVPVKLGFKDVIFVMEDVDAASSIVKRRDGKKTANMVQVDELDMPLPKPLWHLFLESTEASCQELVTLLQDKSERLREEATQPDLLINVTRRIAAVPGLATIGEAGDDPSLQKISEEAQATADKLMADQSSMGEFLARQAEIITNLINQGATVDDEFVDELLGCSPIMSTLPNRLTREISYTKYDGDDELHVETKQKKMRESLVQHLSSAPTQGSKAKPNHQDPNATEKDIPSDTDTMMAPMKNAWANFNLDELNLSGLLNVMDGVVDSPGRILIMTTNHVETLDPALIRPGRIDKKLLLGYMDANCVVQMLEHYFETTLSDVQRSRIGTAISGTPQKPQLRLTPAQVEQMTAEHDDMESMIAALEVKGAVHAGPYRGQASQKSMLAFDL